MQVNSENERSPLVSVIIPSYNRAAFICRAVESALSQTYSHLEVIVVDDGSKDNTKDALKPFLSKIKYIYQENRGNAAARNKGLENARGKYVAFLDSDDSWLNDKVARQTAFLEEHADHAFVYCGNYFIDENGQNVGTRLLQKGEEQTFDNLFIKNRILSLSLVLVRKSALDEVGWLDERLRQSPDYDLYLKLAKKYPYGCIDEPLCRYQLHSGNIRGNLEGRLKAHLMIFQNPEIMQGLSFYARLRRRADACYQVASLYFAEGNYRRAALNYFRCVLRDPYYGLTFADRKFKDIPGGNFYKILKVYYLIFYCLVKNLTANRKNAAEAGKMGLKGTR